MRFLRFKYLLWGFVFLVLFGSVGVYSHCQIPCGIYDDRTRTNLLAEHIRTIEKSMDSIKKLSGDREVDYNQIVRWIENKGDHADKANEIITYYFMAQRLDPKDQGDPGYDIYIQQLTLLHRMQVHFMKTKQSLDESEIKKLRRLLNEFEKVYYKGKDKQN